MANNPNAVANLKPMKKGEKGRNPNGRPRKNPLNDKYKDVEKIKLDTIENLISDLLDKPIEELKALHQDPNTSALEHLVIAEIIRGAKQSGSLNGLNSLIDRLHGKSKQTIDSNVNLSTPPNVTVSFISTNDSKSTDTTTDSADIQPTTSTG